MHGVFDLVWFSAKNFFEYLGFFGTAYKDGEVVGSTYNRMRKRDPVVVTAVEPAGWAGLGGLRSGDLIQRIGENKIRGIKSYRRAMEAVAEQQPERVVFVVLRGVRTRFQYVEPEWKPVVDEEGHEQNQENSDDVE